MNRIVIIFALLLSSYSFSTFAQATSKNLNLTVAYLEEFPYAFTENDKLVGIEVDILESFSQWLKKEKGIDAKLQFEKKETFSDVYEASKSNHNTIASASVTITKERQEELSFSPSYLRNASVLVSPAKIQTLESYSEMPQKFDSLTALVRKGTTHEEELKKIKAFHYPNMVVKYVDTKEEMFEILSKDNCKYFAMVDLVTFWRWKTRGELSIKIHNVATVKNEEFGFAFASNPELLSLFNEFFNSGFKFTSQEEYMNILNAYLGPEIIETVRAK